MARKLASWLKKVLPDNYAEKQAEFYQMDAFLKHFFKADIYKQIQLMSCSSKRVVLAAKSPQIAGYLKIQQQELEAEMQSQLDTNYRVLIKTNPKSMHVAQACQKAKLPEVKRSQSASEAVQQVSKTVNDEGLQLALERLSKSIQSK